MRKLQNFNMRKQENVQNRKLGRMRKLQNRK